MLLCESIRRSQQLLTQADPKVVLEIVELACEKAFIAVCGNSFIGLLAQICRRVDLAQGREVEARLSEFMVHPKLLVTTYRQETRLCLYQLYLKVLNYHLVSPQEGPHEAKLISKCVDSGSGEKDPRNIGSVFELYLRLLEEIP